MGVLQEHQERIAKLRDGLTRLLELHRRVHDLHSESMALAKMRDPGKDNQVQALREQAISLHEEIAMLREYLEAVGDPSAP